MDGDGVSDVSAGAGKRVGGMVNGTGLTSRSIARSGACGVAVLWGCRLVSAMSWRLGVFSESDRGGFGKKVLG